MEGYDLIIIGGGASGLMCAIKAKKSGINKILVIEKNPILGGALNLANFNISFSGNITGIDYKDSLIKEYNESNIDTFLNTMVLNINESGKVCCISPDKGVFELSSRFIILANGWKEKIRNSINIPGDRCSGIYTILNAKNILNMDDVKLGNEIIIYGTKRLYMIKDELKKKNIKVKALVGSKCSNNDITDLIECTYENYNIKSIKGKGRINSILIANSDDEKELLCDTLILAEGFLSDGVVALRSEIQLNPETTGPKVNDNFETSRHNIYACGNGIFIHNFIEEIEEETDKLINKIASL